MVNNVEWRLWLREKERLEEIQNFIGEVEHAIGELGEASSPNGFQDAIFEMRELGGNNVDKELLGRMLFNLNENITINITKYEEYLKNYEED